MTNVTLLQGDCLDLLPTLEAGSVDSIVCDPPYGLSFMGKGWDYGAPGVPFWEAALRVAKPGAMLLAFGGTRTHHRLTCAIEDAGWEIRDCLMWLYGQGFPKSHDIGKAIDKAAGAEREVIGTHKAPGYAKANVEQGTHNRSVYEFSKYGTAVTDEAKKFNGWGTALKPAWEPIIMAMKPLDGTFANNALMHGVAGINVDGCRIGTEPAYIDRPRGPHSPLVSQLNGRGTLSSGGKGRWPANLILDEEAAAMLDEASGVTKGGSAVRNNKNNPYGSDRTWSVSDTPAQQTVGYTDTGGASRFFYCAKASKRDRDEGLEGMPERHAPDAHNLSSNACGRCGLRVKANGSGVKCECGELRETVKLPASRNHHPTVKPTSLMRWLVRLVTPPGGVVLDQFMGSGSTGKAAALEGFNFIGIDREAEYLEIAKRRIEAAQLPFPYGTSLEIA